MALRVEARADRQVLLDREVGEHALAARELHDPELAGTRFGRDVGDVAPVEPHDTALGNREPADDAQDRRLAGTVRAEQCNRLPVLHLEVDVEQHLDGPVGEVEVRDLQCRCHGAHSRALVELLLFLEELLHDEGEVVADEARAVHQQQPADDCGGDRQDDDGAPDADRVGQEPCNEPAEKPADEEDVHRCQRGAHAAESVRDHGPQHRADHRERARRQDGLWDVEDDEQGFAVRREAQGCEQPGRQNQRADDGQRFGWVLPVDAVEVAAENGEQGQRDDPAQAEDDAPPQDAVDVERFVEVQRSRANPG